MASASSITRAFVRFCVTIVSFRNVRQGFSASAQNLRSCKTHCRNTSADFLDSETKKCARQPQFPPRLATYGWVYPRPIVRSQRISLRFRVNRFHDPVPIAVTVLAWNLDSVYKRIMLDPKFVRENP